MGPQEMDEVLRSMLEDHRISRAERRALRELVEERGISNQRLGVFRSRAFDLAEQMVEGDDSKSVVKWLEGTIKSLLPREEKEDATEAEARFSPGMECLGLINGEIDRARRTIDICVFTITDDRIVERIGHALRRKVKVRIITDDDKSLDKGSDIDRMRRGGIDIRMDTSPFHMHHKFAIFDDATLLTGSYNWTRSAASNNQENIVRCTDRTLVGAFGKTFDDLWRRFE
ncbi:MAG: endonuclease [Deltaproteobacteria bacterium]|nr:endonuclease [Deltaproteobacteria bacterium]